MKRIGIIIGAVILLIIVIFVLWIFSRPERGSTGSVSTRFRWIGPNDKIVVDGFDDPKVQGVACHISRAQTGGIKGEFNVAEGFFNNISDFQKPQNLFW
jgi:CreA protein